MQYLDKNELLEIVSKNIRPFKFAVNDFHYYIKQEIFHKNITIRLHNIPLSSPPSTNAIADDQSHQEEEQKVARG